MRAVLKILGLQTMRQRFLTLPEFFLSSLATGPSFMSMSLLVLEL